MITMRTVITVVAVWFAFLSLTATATEDVQQVAVDQQKNDVEDDTGIKIDMSAAVARFVQDYVTPTICSYSPDFCARHQLRKSTFLVHLIFLHRNKQKKYFQLF